MSASRRIAIAMSGGVDSSAAAALLARSGEAAFGLMLRLWSAGPASSNRCCTPDDVGRARSVATQLGIPFYVLDVKEAFKAAVVNPFIRGYAQGITPNPCLACNREIRWGFLLEHALALGATHLATGHYARLRKKDRYELLRAVDRSKDQSYVLSVLTQAQLAQAAFPLGELRKSEVRALAEEFGLASARRPESQDLCFLGEQDYRAFLEAQGAAGQPGPILDSSGEPIGRHQGLHAYTIGQRKGIGVAGPEPYYVLAKRPDENTLIVGRREQLGRSEFSVQGPAWIAGQSPETEPLTVMARYRSSEVPAAVDPLPGGRSHVRIARPLPDITPGQQAVFYSGELCLGGGMILP